MAWRALKNQMKIDLLSSQRGEGRGDVEKDTVGTRGGRGAVTEGEKRKNAVLGPVY